MTPPKEPLRILVIAPHADDESLGMGGTIARAVAAGAEVHVALMTGSGGDGGHPFIKQSDFDDVRGEFHAALDVLGVVHRHLRDLPAVMLDALPTHKVNAATRELIETVRPHKLYLPFAFDLHRDHRELFYSFAVQARAYLPLGGAIDEVWCYETPSETHLAPAYLEPAFSPNAYVDITAHLETKLKAIDCYASQRQAAPLPRSRAAITALAQLRGSQIGAAAAEAFVLIRKIDR
ncbi:MAG: PIG-L deacetylase family protein [Parvularculaceae bacterium]